MRSSRQRLFLTLLPLAAAAAAWAANTQVSVEKPIINFRLPAFTADGHRAWLVRGSEASVVSKSLINIRELTLSVFSVKDEAKVETMILSPAAQFLPDEAVATGESTIRVINDEFEATGSNWRYAHKEKTVSIAKNVRVVFNAELKDILK